MTRWLAAATPAARVSLRRSLAVLDRVARDTHGRALARLERTALDALVAAVTADREAADARAALFALRAIALEAAFAPPSHGGNRDGWGWRLLGSIGDPQPRGFSPQELATAADRKSVV